MALQCLHHAWPGLHAFNVDDRVSAEMIRRRCGRLLHGISSTQRLNIKTGLVDLAIDLVDDWPVPDPVFM
jgi:hypothetical protein